MPTKDAYKNKLGYYLWLNAKQRAKVSNSEFLLTESYVNNLIETVQECPILHEPFTIGSNKYGPSLDKKDSRNGYTDDNTWIVSKLANTMKSNSLPSERILFALWVLKSHPKTLLKRKKDVIPVLEDVLEFLRKDDAESTKA